MTDAYLQGTPKIEKGVLTELGFVTDNITDISPVRALAGLKNLNCSGSVGGATANCWTFHRFKGCR